jgi:hypothetical protein
MSKSSLFADYSNCQWLPLLSHPALLLCYALSCLSLLLLSLSHFLSFTSHFLSRSHYPIIVFTCHTLGDLNENVASAQPLSTISHLEKKGGGRKMDCLKASYSAFDPIHLLLSFFFLFLSTRVNDLIYMPPALLI